MVGINTGEIAAKATNKGQLPGCLSSWVPHINLCGKVMKNSFPSLVHA